MDNKIKILTSLRDFGRLPSNKICAIAGINYDYFKDEIKELLKDKLVSEEKAGELATYWEITKKGLISLK